MRRAKVLDVSLQDQVFEHMQTFQPLPSVYFPDFIAANQAERCVPPGSAPHLIEHHSE
jgi:myo-inositol-1-phosphate synthase